MKKIRQVLALGVLAGVMAMTSACATIENIGDQLSGLVGGFFHQHEFSDEWTKDGDNHWKSCTGDCEEIAEKAAHTFGDGEVTKPATEEAEGEMTYTCTVCGYEKTEAIEKLAHTHKFDEKKWTADAENHWHAATCGHSDAVEKIPHVWDDGEEIEAPTETEFGSALYTCTVCGHMEELQVDKLPHTHKFDSKTWEHDAENHWHPSTCGHDEAVEKTAHDYDAYGVCECGYEHEHTLATEWTYDRKQHWHVASCDHIIELVKTNHSFNEAGVCECGYEYHPLCDNCGECIVEGCEECEKQCAFMYKDSLVHFAPSAVTGAPEGPNGNAYGYTDIQDSVTTEQVILENGAHATKITLTDAVEANSGVSLQNNKDVSKQGLAGWNCGIPQYANVNKVVRLYFTNTGSSKISFRYSAIDYYWDKGAVDVTLEAGESKVVFMNVMFGSNTVGLNHQVVFLSETAKDASLTVYGEFYADGLDKGIVVGQDANKLLFKVGETFSSEGLALRGQSSVIYIGATNTWDRVYITSNYKTDFDGKVFTMDDIGTKTVTVTFGGYSTTYQIEVIDDIDCANGKHHMVKKADESLFVEMKGSDAMYSYVCSECGETLEETYAADKIAFVPHSNIGAGAAMEYVTLADGRIATKLTFANKVTAGTKIGITANTRPADYNTTFPVNTERRVYMEMTASADVKLTWQPEFYGDRDPLSFELTANEAQGKNRIIKYDTVSESVHSADMPYQEIVADSDIEAGTVVYITGYFYTIGEIKAVNVKTPAAKTTFKVGETFSAASLRLGVTATCENYTNTTISNYTTSMDGHEFTTEDIGTKTVVVTWGAYTCTYTIEVTE